MWHVWRRQIATSASVRTRAAIRRALAAVDTSTPANALLDSESVGQNSRETDFSLFPHIELNSLLTQLVRESRQLDLVANLVHRAIHVVETNDLEERDSRRQAFQSAVYAAVFRLVSQNESGGYMPFAIFNRQIFASVAPKVHPAKQELISKLVSQPLLRIATLNRDIVPNPNRIMDQTGVDGFRSIMDLFLLDLRLLSGRNLDRLLDAMKSRKRGEVHFELLRVWSLVWDESCGIDSPPVPGSKWTLHRVLSEVIKKQSKDMLIRLLADSGCCRDSLFAICRSRYNLTGMPKYPWASEIVEEWLIERRLELGSVAAADMIANESVKPVSVLEDGTVQDLSVSERSDGPASTFLVNTDAKLTRAKERVLSPDTRTVGISFVVDSVLSVSTDSESYVIDLKTLNPTFVKFFVKKILNGPTTKIVYSLESLLNRLQEVLGLTEGIHFENVVDLRRGRIRRRLEEIRADEVVPEASLPGILDNESPANSKRNREAVDHIFGRTPLSLMISEHLGVEHDRSVSFHPTAWDYRPLDRELLEFAAMDSKYLVALEESFRRDGFGPTEILSFDPFSS